MVFGRVLSSDEAPGSNTVTLLANGLLYGIQPWATSAIFCVSYHLAQKRPRVRPAFWIWAMGATAEVYKPSLPFARNDAVIG